MSATRTAGFSLVEFDAAGEIDAGTWDRLARRGHHRHAWFAAGEAGGLRPIHIAVRDAGRVCAVIPAYVESSALHGDLHDRWFGAARGVLDRTGPRLRPTVTVGPPFSMASEPLGDWAALPGAVLEEVFERLEERGRVEGAKAVIWPFIGLEGGPIRRIARRRGYAESFAGSSARLDVAWPSFDDYLASRSKNVRRTIRADLRALVDAGCEAVVLEDFRGVAAEFDVLYREAFERRNGYPPRLAPDFFERIAAMPGAGVWAQVVRQRGRLICASLNLEAGGRMDGGFAAVAAGWEGSTAYLHDLVYEPLRLACMAGHRAIELGPTALYPKVLRGAALQPRTTLALGLTPSVHRLLRVLGGAVGRRNVWKERRRLGALAARAAERPGLTVAEPRPDPAVDRNTTDEDDHCLD